jgi:pantothenate kinase
VGDPVPDDIAVEAHHSVLITEGNYVSHKALVSIAPDPRCLAAEPSGMVCAQVLLAAEPWRRLRQEGVLDDTWFVDCPLEDAMRRVLKRQTGNGLAAEVSQWRIAANDLPNAEQVQTTRRHAALIIPNLPLC